MSDTSAGMPTAYLLKSRRYLHQLRCQIKAEDLNDCMLFSLTGLPSSSLLIFLAEIVSEELKCSNKHQLPVKERIVFKMMRMYLKISFSSL